MALSVLGVDNRSWFISETAIKCPPAKCDIDETYEILSAMCIQADIPHGFNTLAQLLRWRRDVILSNL